MRAPEGSDMGAVYGERSIRHHQLGPRELANALVSLQQEAAVLAASEDLPDGRFSPLRLSTGWGRNSALLRGLPFRRLLHETNQHLVLARDKHFRRTFNSSVEPRRWNADQLIDLSQARLGNQRARVRRWTRYRMPLKEHSQCEQSPRVRKGLVATFGGRDKTTLFSHIAVIVDPLAECILGRKSTECPNYRHHNMVFIELRNTPTLVNKKDLSYQGVLHFGRV